MNKKHGRMDGILNPDLIEAVQDHFGLITLAMLLMAFVAIALTRGVAPNVRVGILVFLIVIYAGIILTAFAIGPGIVEHDSPPVAETPRDPRSMPLGDWIEHQTGETK